MLIKWRTHFSVNCYVKLHYVKISLWYEPCSIYVNSDLLRTFLHSEHTGHPHPQTDDGTDLWSRNEWFPTHDILFKEFLLKMANLTHIVRDKGLTLVRHVMSMKLSCYWRLPHSRAQSGSLSRVNSFVHAVGVGRKTPRLPHSCCLWKASSPCEPDGTPPGVYPTKPFSSLDVPKVCLQCEFVGELSTLTSARTLSHISHRQKVSPSCESTYA